MSHKQCCTDWFQPHLSLLRSDNFGSYHRRKKAAQNLHMNTVYQSNTAVEFTWKNCVLRKVNIRISYLIQISNCNKKIRLQASSCATEKIQISKEVLLDISGMLRIHCVLPVGHFFKLSFTIFAGIHIFASSQALHCSALIWLLSFFCQSDWCIWGSIYMT